MRIGIVGLDSTHALEFTRQLNAPTAPAAWRRARVVAACAGAPTDFPLSVTRRDGIVSRIREELGVRILPNATALVESVDGVMILSCDGRCHLIEVLPLLSAGKPLFVDKPLTASLSDAALLLDAAREARCPVFSASALRFRCESSGVTRLTRARPRQIEVTVPDDASPGHPDFAWHGIHGVEIIFAALGSGCDTVQRGWLDDHDAVRATWPDGTCALIKRSAERAAREFPAKLTYEDGRVDELAGFRYEPLLAAMVNFFEDRQSPVSPAEMLEVLAFIDAADWSRDSDGQPIHLSTVLKETAGDL